MGEEIFKNKPLEQKPFGLFSSFACGRQPDKIILFSTRVLMGQVPPNAGEQSEASCRVLLLLSRADKCISLGSVRLVVLINTVPAVFPFQGTRWATYNWC